ncbi:3727_t:CDS:2, partial [Funneliformis caledonium]
TQPLANNTTGTKPLLVRYPVSDSSITDLMPMVGGYAITNHTGIGRLQVTPMVDRTIDGCCCHPLSKPLMVVVAKGDEIDEELDRRNQ